MSLGGQWIGRYSGSNAGNFIIELDDVGDHYEGSATAWDGVAGHFHAEVLISTPHKKSKQELKGLDVRILDNAGDQVPHEHLVRLERESQITYPATIDLNLGRIEATLSVDWLSSTGNSCSGTAEIPKTRDGQKSALKSRRLNTWDGFKKSVNKLESRRFVYRGQESSDWRLRSSFHRTGRSSLQRYFTRDIADLQKAFSSASSHVFNLNDQSHYGAFLNLAQHHGYPTPLLDWTWSPYVAAFFAFHNISSADAGNKNTRIRIFKFDIFNWNRNLSRSSKIYPMWPHVSILDALAFGNPRAIPQQSISTLSNIDDIETYIRRIELDGRQDYLEAFDLPVSERNYAMRELALMGITAGSLFPGLDGACEELKERNFQPG